MNSSWSARSFSVIGRSTLNALLHSRPAGGDIIGHSPFTGDLMNQITCMGTVVRLRLGLSTVTHSRPLEERPGIKIMKSKLCGMLISLLQQTRAVVLHHTLFINTFIGLCQITRLVDLNHMKITHKLIIVCGMCVMNINQNSNKRHQTVSTWSCCDSTDGSYRRLDASH